MSVVKVLLQINMRLLNRPISTVYRTQSTPAVPVITYTTSTRISLIRCTCNIAAMAKSQKIMEMSKATQ